ncbi:hypothetical protein QBC40DRAFT_278311 [Triangularia verruculosa]|uniref:Uncharacterized protein n=1 Tax=Triangularia verruculosa TaxID=2587418 RepID=A0AAN7AW00_9PEZI|nr:hypothetical protein QBC40DRAFT_278311 [Triangularia verruculosa]
MTSFHLFTATFSFPLPKSLLILMVRFPFLVFPHFLLRQPVVLPIPLPAFALCLCLRPIMPRSLRVC